MPLKILTSLFVLAFLFPIVRGKRVLIIPSLVSPSHKMGMVPLADALAEQGHDVLFWAAVADEDRYVPKKAQWKQPKAFTDDRMLNEAFVYKNSTTLYTLPWKLTVTVPALESIIYHQTLPLCENLIREKHKDWVHALSEKWDVVIVDELFNPCGYLLAHLSAAPVITYLSTSCQSRQSAYRNGQPAPRSYVPYCMNLDFYTDRMSFLQRVHSVALWGLAYMIDITVMAISTRRLSAFYPDITDLTKPLAPPDMTFFYFPVHVDFPMPMNPNLVHMGGLHVRGVLKPLPEDAVKLIDKGVNGFILVSTGHVANFAYASEGTKRAFIDALNSVAARGYSVFWQYSGPTFEGLAENVVRFHWLPQLELLAHPKCKAFVSHCGCNSALEALGHGVPIVSLGLLADQVSAAALLEAKGISVSLDKTKLTAADVYDSIMQAATNQSIRQRAKIYADMIRNDLTTPTERAVFWTEYVMRHKGAKRLKTRFPITLASSIKYYCIDVITVMLTVLTLVVCALFKIAVCLWRVVDGGKSKK